MGVSSRSQQSAPAGVITECDVAIEIPAIPAVGLDIPALVLLRLFGEPIAMLELTLPAAGLSAAELAGEIAARFAPELQARFEDCGLAWPGELPCDGLAPPRTPAFVASRELVQRDGPTITIAVCTHERPESLERALASIVEQHYPRFDILVIDNAPQTEGTREVVARLASEHPSISREHPALRYEVEPRPGLSWARNRAAQSATGEVIAWVDDDVVCDPWWATEIARGFVEEPGADVVTGTVVPSELATPSQLMFDRYGSVRRRRGFTRAVFSAGTPGGQSPLYPMPPFGIGANMAFRRDAVTRIGGFDTALGAGTLTRSAEDTAAFSAILLAGGKVVYQPSAVVHHHHRQDDGALRNLMLAHGRGLGAFYTSMVLRRPTVALELARLLPRALRDQFSSRGPRLSRLGDGFPPELLRANRVGIVQGPWFYARARREARRLRGADATASRDPASGVARGRPGSRSVETALGGAILPAGLVATALGTLLIAIGFAGSRAHDSWASWPFWIGWVMSTVVLGVAITSPRLSARARVMVVVIQAAQQSFVRWMYSPLSFTFPDELSHWRTATDILRFHHLYHTNPRLPVSAVFPGLEEVTTALVSLTHIGLFTAGTIVVATSHIMLAPASYYLFRRVGGSARRAGIAAFAFAMNPLHAGFDTMFIYQAPALLLGMVVLETVLEEHEGGRDHARASIALALICLAGLVVTHHLTAAVFILSLAVVGLLLAVLSGFTPKAKRVLGLAVAGVVMAFIWVIIEAGSVLSYLGTPLGNTISGVIHFGSNAGTVALPATNQGTSGGWLTVLATIVTALLVLIGGWTVWRRPRDDTGRSVIVRAFAVCALSYFAVLGVRAFAPDGAELSGRLLVFAALFTSVTIAVALVSGLPVRETWRRWGRLAAVAALVVIFVGAKTSGWPAPWEQLPGTFHADAFESGVDRQNTAAVRWFAAHVGPNRRVVCDASICALLDAYAEATPIPNEGQFYYSRSLTRGMIATIHKRGLDYLFVDLRESQAPPITGNFFHANPSQSGSQDGPVPIAGLTKFSHIQGIQQIYDNGPIQIYDLRKLGHG